MKREKIREDTPSPRPSLLPLSFPLNSYLWLNTHRPRPMKGQGTRHVARREQLASLQSTLDMCMCRWQRGPLERVRWILNEGREGYLFLGLFPLSLLLFFISLTLALMRHLHWGRLWRCLWFPLLLIYKGIDWWRWLHDEHATDICEEWVSEWVSVCVCERNCEIKKKY